MRNDRRLRWLVLPYTERTKQLINLSHAPDTGGCFYPSDKYFYIIFITIRSKKTVREKSDWIHFECQTVLMEKRVLFFLLMINHYIMASWCDDLGDITNYLGINITTTDANTIQMVQLAMINRIIDTLGLKDDRQHDTPSDPNVKLHKDKDGLPCTDEWHYRSLIGHLNYLMESTQPDIQFTVHQCA